LAILELPLNHEIEFVQQVHRVADRVLPTRLVGGPQFVRSDGEQVGMLIRGDHRPVGPAPTVRLSVQPGRDHVDVGELPVRIDVVEQVVLE
jgi:hypothetical protein